MTKFSNFIRNPGTAGPATLQGIYDLGFALRSQWPEVLAKYVRVDAAQTFTSPEKAQGRANIGAVIGADVQAYSASLTSIAGLTTASDELAYTTGPDVWAVTPLTAFGRSLIDDANASAARDTLGLGTMATQAANAVAITGGTISGVPFSDITLNSPVIVGSPNGEFLRGHINGLTLSNNATDATNDIDIATGSAASDGATPVLMTLGSVFTKRLDAAWAVGSGNGGWLDGASMPDGWGFAFLIRRSDTGVVDVGFSASTSPTLPTNYDRKRRIGAIIRASGAIRAFKQDGDWFNFGTVTTDVSTTLGTSAVLYALPIPAGIGIQVRVRVMAFTTSAYVLISSPNETDQSPTSSGPLATVFTPTTVSSGEADVFTSTGEVRGRSSAAGVSIRLAVIGWFDQRGRF